MEQRKSDSHSPKIVNAYVEDNNKTGRFITLSIFVHAAMITTVALMSFPQEVIPKHDLVEIEMVSDGEPAASLPADSGITGSTAEKAESLPAEEPMTSAPMAAAPTLPSAPVAAAAAAPAPAPEAAVVKSAPAPAAPAMAALPENLNDIEAPELETIATGEVPVSSLDDKDLQEDFEKVDQRHQARLENAKKELEEEAAKTAAAGEAVLAKAQADLIAEQSAKQAAAEAEAAAAAAEARRQKDAETLAAAKAEAIAAARKARAEELGRAEAARAALAKGTGNSSSESNSPEGTKQVDGIPGAVRSLGQLRQKPGNKYPQYEPKERLLGQEGHVVYYAYVNRDGTLSEFKISESTGHKNLDEKTLAALKTWKFYPGQEGWVEMPFQWSLKGEAQQAGGLLR